MHGSSELDRIDEPDRDGPDPSRRVPGPSEDAAALDSRGLIDTFRALAHPSRLALLRNLARGERSVSDLAAAVGLRQPAASLHLARLHEGGLIERRSVSRNVLYRLSPDPTMRYLVRLACSTSAAPAASRDDGDAG